LPEMAMAKRDTTGCSELIYGVSELVDFVFLFFLTTKWGTFIPIRWFQSGAPFNFRQWMNKISPKTWGKMDLHIFIKLLLHPLARTALCGLIP
jgi:hypothetical protein